MSDEARRTATELAFDATFNIAAGALGFCINVEVDVDVVVDDDEDVMSNVAAGALGA